MVCHETFRTKENKWIDPKTYQRKGTYWTNQDNKKIEL